MWILDTDHISILEYSGSPTSERLRRKLKSVRPNEYGVSTISYEEQCRGWLAKISNEKRVADQVILYRKLREQLEHYGSITVMDFDEHAATKFQQLKTAKVGVKTMDLKIASVALARNATLLTRNAIDFIKVPNLRFEDWTKG